MKSRMTPAALAALAALLLIAAAPRADNPNIVAFVAQQFALADADGDGKLSVAEFVNWITARKKAELAHSGETPDPDALRAFALGALSMADANGDKTVTRLELIHFYGG